MESNEAAERARLAAEQERVMNESRPTPSPSEIDAVKTGQMNHDDKQDPENPEMPPLHEQHARIARSRDGARKEREAAPDGDRAPYRTRQVTAERAVAAPPSGPAKEEDKDKAAKAD